MIIDLTHEYRIRTDPLQWIVERKTVHNGKERWKGVAFYTTAQACFNGAANRMVRELDTHGFAESIAAVEKLAAEIGEKFAVNVGEKA